MTLILIIGNSKNYKNKSKILVIVFVLKSTLRNSDTAILIF